MAEIHPFRRSNVVPKRSRQEIWREFIDDSSVHELHRITERELELLQRTAMLGEFHCTEDLIFMLKVIRRGHR